jgi:hypothetical protein
VKTFVRHSEVPETLGRVFEQEEAFAFGRREQFPMAFPKLPVPEDFFRQPEAVRLATITERQTFFDEVVSVLVLNLKLVLFPVRRELVFHLRR